MNFREQLADQLDFIDASCQGFGAGRVREGVRIATALRVLFHQTTKSNSLLTHLNAAHVALLSTCAVPNSRQVFFPALTAIQLDPMKKRMEFIPKLSVDYEREVSFNQWWSREIVYLAKSVKLKITRKDLVLGAANKDGGAHVDSTLDPQYDKVLEGLGWKMTLNPENEPSEDIPCKHGHLAALRQMGYEVLNSPALLTLK